MCPGKILAECADSYAKLRERAGAMRFPKIKHAALAVTLTYQWAYVEAAGRMTPDRVSTETEYFPTVVLIYPVKAPFRCKIPYSALPLWSQPQNKLTFGQTLR